MRIENPKNRFERRNNFLVDVAEEVLDILEEKKLTHSEVGKVCSIIHRKLEECVVSTQQRQITQ